MRATLERINWRIVGYQGTRLLFACAFTGVLVLGFHQLGMADLLAGLMAGAYGMASWKDTALTE